MNLTAASVGNARDDAPIDRQTIFDAAFLSNPVFAYAVRCRSRTGKSRPLAASLREPHGTGPLATNYALSSGSYAKIAGNPPVWMNSTRDPFAMVPTRASAISTARLFAV